MSLPYRSRSAEGYGRHVPDLGFQPPSFVTVEPEQIRARFETTAQGVAPAAPSEDEAAILRRELLADVERCRQEAAEHQQQVEDEKREKEEKMVDATTLWIDQMEGRVPRHVSPPDESEGAIAASQGAGESQSESTLLIDLRDTAEETGPTVSRPTRPETPPKSARQWYFPEVGALSLGSGASSNVSTRQPTPQPSTSTASKANVVVSFGPTGAESIEARQSREAQEELRRLVGEDMCIDSPDKTDKSNVDMRDPPTHSRLNILPIECNVASGPFAWDSDMEVDDNQTARTSSTWHSDQSGALDPGQFESASQRSSGAGSRTLDNRGTLVVTVETTPSQSGPSNQQLRRGRGQSKGRRAPAQLKIKLGGVKFGNLKPIPTDPTVDPPPYACFNCWDWGHSVFDCKEPQTTPFCYNCGRREVDMMNCPRCGDRHREFLGTGYQGRPRSMSRRRDPSTSRRCEEQTASKPAQNRGRGTRSNSQTIRWASPLEDRSDRGEYRGEVRESRPGNRVESASSTRGREQSPSPPRHNKSQSTARRSSRATPYGDEARRDSERASNSPTSSSSEQEDASGGVVGAISDTLRLMEELRNVPADIREAILC